jgi:hypothetical protein
MDIKTKIFYEVIGKDIKANRTDIVTFLEDKDYDAKVETLKTQISTIKTDVKTGNKVEFIRTRNEKSKIIMNQILQDVDDIPDIVQTWAEDRAYESFLNGCLKYLYEQEVLRSQ